MPNHPNENSKDYENFEGFEGKESDDSGLQIGERITRANDEEFVILEKRSNSYIVKSETDGKEYLLVPDKEKGYGTWYDTPKTTRRNILKVIGVTAAGVAGFFGAREGLKETDTDVGKALRFLDAYENISSKQEDLEKLQQEFNADTVSVLKSPDAYTEQLRAINKAIKKVTEEVQKINRDGIKVNSGFVYRQQKKIQTALARFNNENFSTVFTALGIYRGATGKATEIINKISSEAQSLVGGALGGYATKFINEQTAEAKKAITGNITVHGVEIPIASLAKFALEAQNLSSSLAKLQNELEKLGDPDIEVSNNDWIKLFSNENPRKDFYAGFDKIRKILIKRNKEGGFFEDDEVKEIQKFMVEYGYIVSLGKDGPVNGKYDEKTKKALKKFTKILNSAPKYREEFRKQVKKGNDKPVIERGQDVRDLQDLLGLAGYMSLKQVDGAYGWTTYLASVKCTKDWSEYSDDED